MSSFVFAREIPGEGELVDLYQAVGWTSYTNEPDRLIGAVRASCAVYTARSAAGELAGLARVISDGYTVVYLQDLLVSPPYQRRGVGRELMRRVVEDADGIRQFVLLTDNDAGQRAFYEACGLIEAREVTFGALRAFVRLK